MKQIDNLTRDATAAIMAGMSYGKYMATKKPIQVEQQEPEGYRHECTQCGNVFYTKTRIKKKYCSEECKDAASKQAKAMRSGQRICPICNKEFESDSLRQKYCGPFCVKVAQGENVKRHLKKKQDAEKEAKISEEG